ncbi:YdcF family protein [Methylocystis sp. JAN1]|uniref:YdcF family protein n=1 Tax=Methylocystis sp. JAN1 TaxID=3397211 RepID=UPI003FA293BB
MFYWIAKTFWVLASPPNLIGLGLAIGAAGLFSRFARLTRRLALILAIAYLAAGFGPVGAALLRPLEDRFPRPPDDMPSPEGIIVLGGAMDDDVTAAREAVTLNESGTRLMIAVALARRFPDAKLVYSGGSSRLDGRFGTEADAARALFEGLGVASDRMIFENQSRDTFENAAFTYKRVRPRPDSRWLLVTSAFHLPRSVAIFQKVGFPIIPYPAGYLTLGDRRDFWQFQTDASHGLMMTSIGLHEWIGLIAYRLAGRSNTILP